MSRAAQDQQVLRGLRSLLMMTILTCWSTYSLTNRPATTPISEVHVSWWKSFAVGVHLIHRGAFPPHGNPIVYSLAMSWLVVITIAFATGAIFFRANPTLFSLAHWEKEGKIYDRAGIRALRRVLVHSPLGWINPTIHLRVSRADCERLLRKLNSSEGIHWLTFIVSVMLAISCLLRGYGLYGCVMLLVRIPFDVYPIMLQRWNRGRVRRVLER